MTDSTSELRFEYLCPEQVKIRREQADVAFLPLGSLEWHGIQNPLGTDALKAHFICCLAARKLGGGVVFPALLWGVPRDSFYVGTASSLGPVAEPMAAVLGTDAERIMGFCRHGGMDAQEQWLFFQRLVRMALEQVAAFGFRSVYICSGHNPLLHWARPVAVAFARASSMAEQPVTVNCGNEYDAAGLQGDHGGKWETSLMLAASPEHVDADTLARRPELRGVGAGADAVEANQAQGHAWADTCAAAIAAEARWLVDHYPELPPQHTHGR